MLAMVGGCLVAKNILWERLFVGRTFRRRGRFVRRPFVGGRFGGGWTFIGGTFCGRTFCGSTTFF
jgi:hypothetical protein